MSKSNELTVQDADEMRKFYVLVDGENTKDCIHSHGMALLELETRNVPLLPGGPTADVLEAVCNNMLARIGMGNAENDEEFGQVQRSDKDIREAFEEYDAKVQWYFHQFALCDHITKKEQLTAEQIVEIEDAVSQIERKYGTKDLQLGEGKFDELYGRREALAWVLGDEWDEELCEDCRKAKEQS